MAPLEIAAANDDLRGTAKADTYPPFVKAAHLSILGLADKESRRRLFYVRIIYACTVLPVKRHLVEGSASETLSAI
jgi:hypothetical protein